MSDDIRKYEGAALDVFWDKKRCIHAAECGRGLRTVFDGPRTPWIEPDNAPVEDVVKVIERCPTGALTYERKDGGPAEKFPARNTVQVAPHGPLYASGEIALRKSDGSEFPPQARVALCRCGQSKVKPYCDDSHLAAGFKDAGPVASDPAGETPGPGRLTVKVARNGPLLLSGPVCVRSAGGRDAFYGQKIALCRCGASENKPFCDGKHNKIGFDAD